MRKPAVALEEVPGVCLADGWKTILKSFALPRIPVVSVDCECLS